MKNLLSFLLLPLFSFGQVNGAGNDGKLSGQTTASKANKLAEGFTVTGTIQGLADGVVKITSTRGDVTIASGESKNGVFTLKGTVAEPGLYWLAMGKEQPRYLFLENAAIKISGSKADIKNIKIEGSASHKDFAVFEQTFNPLFGNLNAVVAELNKAKEDKKPALINQYTEALGKLNAEVQKFISLRKSSYVSLLVLSVTMQSNENILEVEHNFSQLSEALKASQTGKEIASYISYAKVGAIGTNAIDFTQNDVSDKPVSLSSFKGKYVLIDFWASWCRPCRAENPNVVKIYKKFKDKNFTVLGVSLDQQKDAWVKAIERDGLAWTHVSDLQQWNNAVAQLYRVQSIPQNFLIDPNGKIVAKDLRGEDLEKTLCEYLGCSN
ncbi:MAG: AhpC/TSA family protein [Bacteroidota bacterium]|nr:AhpC/TSA family protein [Bacteroidota bacterium]